MLSEIKSFFENANFAAIVPVFLWIGVLFFFSTGKASISNTSRFIQPLLKFFFPKSSEASLNKYHAFIRKLSHFCGYGILAFFAYLFFTSLEIVFFHTFRFPLSLGLVILIATLDEFHQSFSPNRVGSVSDVILDTCGGLTILLIIFLIF